MRLIAFMVVVLGILLAFGYPAWVDLRPSGGIARYSLNPAPGAAAGPTLDLAQTDAPLALILEVEAAIAVDLSGLAEQKAEYSLVMLRDGVEFDRASVSFDYDAADGKILTRQDARRTKTVLVADPVPAGRYRVEVMRLDAGALPLAGASLIVHRNHNPGDDRIAPIGFVLLVLGGIAFVLTRRRKPVAATQRPPRSHKWGR